MTMNSNVEYEFCMKQFKPAIAGLAILLVLVLGWSIWDCSRRPQSMDFTLLAAATKPPAKTINVKDKMVHPYWGNCNKCHITVGNGKPVSQVMAGVPISIKDKMTHEYWGNCLLCHKVIDGFQAPKKGRAIAVALNRFTAQTLGLKIQSVTAAAMQKFGLPNEDGVLVLEVVPDSVADRDGLKQGDEIIRVGKVRLDTTKDFDTALQAFKPGDKVKMSIYRGKKKRKLFVRLPENLPGAIAAAPATPKHAGALMAEQPGAPKPRQDVVQAIQGHVANYPNLNYGKLAVAATGPGLGYSVSSHFGSSPYFIIFDPAQNSHSVVANPNANDETGKGVQTGQYMVDLGVNNVVAGSFNQSALNTLHTLRVNVFSGVTGLVQQVIGIYLTGKLIPSSTITGLQLAAPVKQPQPVSGSPNVQVVY